MRIAVDAMTICDADGGEGAGIEHYTWSILYTLARAFPQHVFLLLVPHMFSQPRMDTFVRGISNIRFLPTAKQKIPFVTRHLWHAWRLMLHRPDVLFAPSGHYPFAWKGPTVATVHDVLIYQHAEWFAPDQRSSFSTRVLVPLAISGADRLVCVSRATEQALHELFPVTAQKTTVVAEGVDIPDVAECTLTPRFPYDRDYVLFVGTIEPRKNIPNALRAFERFLEGHPEQATQNRFILAGAKGWQTTEVDDEIARMNAAWKDIEPSGVMHWLGRVTDEEKWTLLSRAACLLFPSFDEGFGLPLLEAIGVGTPVITTRRGALEEVGGDVPIYLEPDDVEGMSLSIAQCLLVPEGVAFLREQGKHRARQFTWERTAQDIGDVLEAVVDEQQKKNRA